MKTIYLLIFLWLVTACNQNQNTAANKQYLAHIQQKKIKVIEEKFFDFEQNTPGKLPHNWSEYFTGKGQSTKWQIVNVQNNKVLAQLSSQQPNYHFNVAVYNDLKAKNIDLSVKMKAIDGKMDQGGGFVWRFIDANNYYVVRANPLEDNVVLYKVINGHRTDLPLIGKGRTYGIDVEKLGKKWHNFRVKVEDNLFTVYLNGHQLFQVIDKSLNQAGKVGLWTKADAVTYFDDFKIKKLK